MTDNDFHFIQLDFHFAMLNNTHIEFCFSQPCSVPRVTEMPVWLADLDDEDGEFIRRFVLASGSLKELAEQYGVSYPTLRARLDRLIARVQATSASTTADPLERAVRVLVADGSITAATGKQLLAAHRASQPKGGKS